jgi:hypothetical protein
VCCGASQEREEVVARNKREIDSLFEKRRECESKFVEDKMAREEQYQTEVSGGRTLLPRVCAWTMS